MTGRPHIGLLGVPADDPSRGIGSGLLEDAVLRAIQPSAVIRVRALVCHAIDEEAMGFYLQLAAITLDATLII